MPGLGVFALSGFDWPESKWASGLSELYQCVQLQ